MSTSKFSVMLEDPAATDIGKDSTSASMISQSPEKSNDENTVSQIRTEMKDPPMPKSIRFKLTVLFLCGLSAIAAMDTVIVGAALAAIAKDLNTTSVEAFWVGTSYLLSQTVMIPIYGTVSEIFGRKWTMITAIAIFTFGSILCATAKWIGWLIAGRTVQGVGAGGMVPLVQVILSDITTMEERGLYMAIAAFAWAIGINIGLPIGGAIGHYTTWRWIFWINIPICVVCEAGLVYSLHLQKDTSSFAKKLARVDWLGISIFTCASTLFLIGVTAGGVSHPWKSGAILGPLITGALLYVTFILVEWSVAKQPMMPLRIFNDRTAITGFVTSFLHGLVVWGYVYYLIIFFLGSLQHGILHASIETMSAGAYSAPVGIVTSIIIKKTLKFKYLIIIGWAFLAAGMGVNITMHPNSSKAILYAPRCIGSIGAGMLFPTPLFAAQARQKGHDVGIATTVQVFFRLLGAAFGVGLGGVIFQNQWTNLINKKIAAGKIPKQYVLNSNLAEVGYETIKSFPKAVQIEYRSLYSGSLDAVWWVLMGLSLLGFAVSLIARDERLGGGLSGSQNFQDKRKKVDVEETGRS